MKKIIKSIGVTFYVSMLLRYRRFKINSIPNVRLGKNVAIDLFTIIEDNTSIGRNSSIESTKIGRGTYLSENCAMQHTKIGRFCAIADNVRSGMGSHPTHTWVSIHPAFFSNKSQAGFKYSDSYKFNELPKIDNSDYVVEIGNDVWIGTGVKILDGITIGDGAIIGANATVTKDIEPYSINVGVPARQIKKRFNEIQIKFLLDFQWWNKDHYWLKENCEFFNDIEAFRNKNQSFKEI